jgi:DNA invertase Pin-like site-specific DNA recombinase
MSRSKLRVLIYVRMSKDIAGLGIGVERQLHECEQLAARRPEWEVVATRIENDMSATNKKKPRPLFLGIVDQLKRGEIDVVLCWAQDRFLREPREIEQLIDIAEQHPFSIEGVVDAGHDLSSASGRHYARNNVANSKAEVERKVERQKLANRRRAELGMPSRTRAFGYDNDGNVVEEEAAVVKEVFAQFVNGATLGALVETLNASGLQSATRAVKKRNSGWSPTGVRLMLKNARYVGQVWYLGQHYTTATAQWQSIIDDGTWAATQLRLSDPDRKTNKIGPARKWLGSGLFKCGDCGDTVMMHHCGTTRKGGKVGAAVRISRHSYVCQSKCLSRMAEPIDELVDAVIVKRLRELADVAPLFAQTMNNSDAVIEKKRKRDQLEAMTGQLGIDEYEGRKTRFQVETMTKRIVADMAVLDDEIAQLGKSDALAEILGHSDPGAVWLSRDVWRRHAVVEILCDVVLLHTTKGKRWHHSSVRFDWKDTAQLG